VRGTNYEVPLFQIFSIFSPLPLSYIQITFSAPCSQTPSTYNGVEIPTVAKIKVVVFWVLAP
jgi:hypothetical protein